MAQRKKKVSMPLLSQVLKSVGDRLRGPLAIILGSPGEVLPFLADLPRMPVTCYEMDLYPAQRLREELEAIGLEADVAAAPDLWDLPPEFQTVVYPAPKGGERELKIDMVEQAHHILRPHGTFIVATPFQSDQFFPRLLKKTFGRVHMPNTGQLNTVLWCTREGDRPRRRHEVTFQVRGEEGHPSLRFVSRPGVFTYGRMDEGARALLEAAVLDSGENVLDVGCGCGTNGIMAAQRTGRDSSITFVDSNLRALALTDLNAQANGLVAYKTVATATMEGLPVKAFDVALANPPYFAHAAIAKLFIQRSRALLKPGGRFYLVTKQPKELAPLVVESFGETDAVMHRGYTILAARVAGPEKAGSLFRIATDIFE
ncbi:MAG: class I SAM-dependent methyltransferase [Gemmataceae bacterium]